MGDFAGLTACARVALIVVATGHSGLAADSSAGTRFEFEQIRFAAPAHLTFYAASEALANQVSRQVFDRLKALDRIMSDYDPDSELSRLCEDSGPGRPVSVGEDLWSILNTARRFSERTQGDLDVSIGPSVRLWRTARRTKTLPGDEMIQQARDKVDWKSIVFDERDRKVELRKTGMQLDLGGIAQGYAADEAYRILSEAGITRVLIDISGDIRVGDPPPGQPGWRIAVQSLEPRGEHSAVGTGGESSPRMLQLANTAVSTSGDAYQSVEINGVRYSHIVDPATGLGLKRSSSVTIIAPDATTADALATAVSVQGPTAGLRLLDDFEGVVALFAELGEDGMLHTTESPGWKAFEAAPQ